MVLSTIHNTGMLNTISYNILFKNLSERVKYIVFMAIMLCVNINVIAQININPNQTALALAQKLSGAGVIITNPTLTCNANANGIFNVVSSNLGIDSGILLTTGRAATNGINIGANSAPASIVSFNNGNPGDPFLDTYIGKTTFNSCALEFDFRASGDTVKFNYKFASEEYTDWSCSDFNDVFGFFISGPGITGQQNIALIPGTTIPVSVNSTTNTTINTPVDIAECTIMGPGSPFATYYAGSHTNASYDGFTTMLTAVSAIYPCSTYHLKLIIADANDGTLDSGVWLQAGSLSSNPAKIAPISGGANNTEPYVLRGCKPGKFVFTRNSKKPTPKTVKYDILGTASNGVDYVLIPDSVVIPANDSFVVLNIIGIPVTPAAGPMTIKLRVKEIDCNGFAMPVDSAEMQLLEGLRIDMQSLDTAVCQGQGMLVRANGEPDYTYSWTPLSGVLGPNTLEPLLRPDTTTTYTLTANYADCPTYKNSITVEVQPNPIVTINSGSDTTVCQWYTIPLTAHVKQAWFSPYTYSWTPATDLSATSLPDVNFTANNTGEVIATLTTPIGCTGSDTINVNIHPGNFGIMPPAKAVVCPNDTAWITVDGGVDYRWTPTNSLTDSTGPTVGAYPDVQSDYTVYITDVNNCYDTLSIPVSISSGASLYAGEDIYLHPGERYQVYVQGNCTQFEWFPNVGLNATNVFNPVIDAKVNTRYFIAGSSADGCIVLDTLNVYMVETELDMPNAFAPYTTNHDLKIVKRGIATLKYFRIFNRWGQKVFETQDINKGWDGRFNGEDQPMGTYIYAIDAETDAGKRFYKEGNVTLIR